jgi:hypothetical protein
MPRLGTLLETATGQEYHLRTAVGFPKVAQTSRPSHHKYVGKPAKKRTQDVALLYAPTDDEKGARFVRARNGQLQAGEVRPLAEGQSLSGQELVRMHPRAEMPNLCDVEVVHPAEVPMRDTQGPAQVASERYRKNWDVTFGSQKPSGKKLTN